MPIKKIDVRKGMRVLLDRDARVSYVQGYGGITAKKDSEILVTAVRNDSIYGKLNGVYKSVQVHLSIVSEEKRKLGVPPEGALDAHDDRVRWVFEDAARMADRLGLCSDFDRLCNALGFPGRLRKWKIESEAAGMKVTVEVEAHSRREALEQITARVGELPSLTSVKAITS